MIGFCLLMLSSTDSPLAQEYIPFIRAAGYDYAEIPFAKLSRASEKEIHSYRACFQQEGLEVFAFNNGMSPSFRLLGHHNVQRDWSVYCDRVMELAHFFGVSVITSCAPYLDSVEDGFEWDSFGREQYIDFLRFMDENCIKNNVKYAIEPIFQGERSFVSTLSETTAILDRAKCSCNIGICPDFFHMRMENEGAKDLIGLIERKQVLHLHYADPYQRSAPTCERQMLYRDDLVPLLQSGYLGRISVEAKISTPEQELADARKAICIIQNSLVH